MTEVVHISGLASDRPLLSLPPVVEDKGGRWVVQWGRLLGFLFVPAAVMAVVSFTRPRATPVSWQDWLVDVAFGLFCGGLSVGVMLLLSMKDAASRGGFEPATWGVSSVRAVVAAAVVAVPFLAWKRLTGVLEGTDVALIVVPASVLGLGFAGLLGKVGRRVSTVESTSGDHAPVN